MTPAFLLKNFTADDGYLYVFDRRAPERGVFRAEPKSVFAEKHLYSRIGKDGTRDPQLEIEFAELESRAAPLIRERIIDQIRSGKNVKLDSVERHILYLFWYVQWKRPPDFHEHLFDEGEFNRIVEESLNHFESLARPLTENERENFSDPETRSKMLKNARLDALRMITPGVIDVLKQVGVNFVQIERMNRSFIIGSNPVVKLTTNRHKTPGQPEVEVWFPVAHDIAMLWFGTNKDIRTKPITEDRHIRFLNEMVARQSRRIAGRSKRLVQSLIDPR